MEPVDFVLHEGEILSGYSSKYQVLKFLGEGCFGQVAKFLKFDTCDMVAVKIQKGTNTENINREVAMFEVVSVLDSVKDNIVCAFESFVHLGHTCLVFEMLDLSLYDLLEKSDWLPFSLSEIRPVTHQILMALDALKRIGVIHSDIKLDNIMLVNNQDQPYKVKLIDFGLALRTSEVKRGMIMQPIPYRAPEVVLGLPFTEAIDMWGLGCVIASMYLGDNLFDGRTEYQLVECIVHIVGQPNDDLLSAGLYTREYFVQNQHYYSPKWRLKTPGEYCNDTGIKLTPRTFFMDIPPYLDELTDVYPEQEFMESDDRRAFLSLLKGMMNVDVEQRLTPRQALGNSFLTMSHLAGDADSF
ncbi:hypothetical protein LDENG_00048880 [Lucifuga dentata]|nr:hypothetical protein LDENG_00048880 [Lucifuga dentata]